MSTLIQIPSELKFTIIEPYEGPEVRAIKYMLNTVIRSSLDTESSKFGPKTSEAVRIFQRSERLFVDGKVGIVQTYPALLQAYRYHYKLLTDPGVPAWLKAAYGEFGVKEVSGRQSNHRIIEYLNTCPALTTAYEKTKNVPVLDRKTGKPRLDAKGKPKTRNVWDTDSRKLSEIDETAWCSAFVNWCLKRAGLPGMDSSTVGLAESWLDYGTEISSPRYGAVTVIYNGSMKKTSLTSSGNHVGFLIDGGLGNSVTLLGGNQSNQVKISKFTGWEIKGFIWPISTV